MSIFDNLKKGAAKAMSGVTSSIGSKSETFTFSHTATKPSFS